MMFSFQAYFYCQTYRMLVKMPVTSNMIRTAIFYLISHSSSQLSLEDNQECKELKNALSHVASKQDRMNKLEFKSNNTLVKWTTEKDLHEYGEEARVWAKKIFSLIKNLAEKGWKLNSFWNRRVPIEKVVKPDGKGFGEDKYILDICDCALDKLKKETFFN